MYHYTPFFTNPGQIGTVEDVRLMLNYRNQAIEVGDNFTSSSLSAFYPLNVGNHRLVIAGNFLNDQASDFVTTNGGLLGVAYAIRVSEKSTLSLGLQGGYYRRDTESDFTTDDQFVDGAFDPNAVSSDAALNRNKSYPTLSGGLFYKFFGQNGLEKAFIGASIFNATEPNVSLVDDNDDNLPLSFRATAGYQVYEAMKFSVMPTFRWVNQVGNNFLNLGSRFGYSLGENEEGPKKIELGLWYNTNDLGVFSLAYEQPNIIVAASYDLPVGDELNIGQNGIFELAVSLRLKKKEKPVRKTEASTQTSETQTIEEETETQTEETGEAEPETQDEQEKSLERMEKSEEPKKVERVVPGPSSLTVEEEEMLTRTVRFDFNTDRLDEESIVFLDSVAGILVKKTDLKVELVGHSCNIGPEQANQELSEKRARSVQSYLVQKGINEKRFVVIGKGEEIPVMDNSTEPGRNFNRRVEFKMVYN